MTLNKGMFFEDLLYLDLKGRCPLPSAPSGLPQPTLSLHPAFCIYMQVPEATCMVVLGEL